jgi:hypothetical protein
MLLYYMLSYIILAVTRGIQLHKAEIIHKQTFSIHTTNDRLGFEHSYYSQYLIEDNRPL